MISLSAAIERAIIALRIFAARAHRRQRIRIDVGRVARPVDADVAATRLASSPIICAFDGDHVPQKFFHGPG